MLFIARQIVSITRKESASVWLSKSPKMAPVPTWPGKVCSLNLYRQDKAAAETAVRVAVSSKDIRTLVAMLDALRAVMTRYGKKRMVFKDFSVKLTKNGIPLVQGKRTATRCPRCGGLNGNYLQTVMEGAPRSRDLVAWGCRQCGEIFNRWEVNSDDAG